MKRLLLLLCLAAPIALLAQPAAKPADELDAQLDRILNKKAYEAKKFGPSRWVEDGKAYTTVEPSVAGDGKDIVPLRDGLGRAPCAGFRGEPDPDAGRQAR